MRGEPHPRWIDTAKDATRAVSNRPLRSLLTSLGIAFGLAAAVATLILTLSASNAVSGEFAALTATRVTVEYPEGVVPDLARLDDLRQIDGVREVSFMATARDRQRITTARFPTAPDVDVPVNLVAAQPTGPQVLGATLVAGRWSDAGIERRADRALLLDTALVTALGWEPVSAVGRTLFIAGRPGVVMGVFQAPAATPMLTAAVVVPYSTAADNAQGFFGRRVVIAVRPGAAAAVGEQAPLALDPVHPQQLHSLVPAQLDSLREGVQGQTTALFLGLSVLSLLVGSLGVATTMVTAVIERRGEIGLRRALGARRRDVAAQFVFESTILGALGALVGTLVGLFVAVVVCRSQGWLLIGHPGIIVGGPLLGGIAGALAGALPAVSATRVDPADSLRHGGL